MRPHASGGDPLSAARARILAFGRGRLASRPEYANIASAIGVAQYAAIAAEVAARLGGGRVLDWGAGWGQNSLLMRAHGLDVVAYDVEDKGVASGLLAGLGVPYVLDAGPRLPFGGEEFDAVLNCGVLEHVGDEAEALSEISRVLRRGGCLFTYHLPNRHAYTEWLGRRLGGFHHDRTYTRRQAVAALERARFHVLECRPFHILPRNIWGRTPLGRLVRDRGARAYERLDAGLLRVPGLSRLATAWALVAERRG